MDALLKVNTQMYKAIITQEGTINKNPNLDGFIAEQFKAGTFNLDATIKERPYGAVTPQSIQKNSPDIIVIDGNKGEIVKRYQEKFGKDATATELYLEKGNYKGQIKGVPLEQAKDIKDSEGYVSYEDVKGKGLTKFEVKELQKEVQSGDTEAVKFDWNTFCCKRCQHSNSAESRFCRHSICRYIYWF